MKDFFCIFENNFSFVILNEAKQNEESFYSIDSSLHFITLRMTESFNNKHSIKMQLIFSDAQFWGDFLPLTYTKPIAELRTGILTFSERWQKLLDSSEVSYITEDYLQKKYKSYEKKESLLITPNVLPSESILAQIKNLQLGEALIYENEVLAARLNMENFSLSQIEKMTDITEELIFFKKATDLFFLNDKAIDFDFQLVTKGRTSAPLS